MNVIQLYKDNHIHYDTEGKNVSPGWVATRCVFCADSSNHLGYNINYNYFHCWKCGRKNTVETISRLLSVDNQEAKRILYQYRGNTRLPKPKKPQEKPRLKAFSYPSNTNKMGEPHRRYLQKRGFDPDHLEKIWRLQGTGPVAMLGDKDYGHRIIIPIEWQGRVVSFQGRDTTDKATLRYKACPMDRELVHHKNIVYAHPDLVKNPPETIIVVEGVTDVWRLGRGAVATFGIKFKPEQVTEIKKFGNTFCVLFDNEKQARAQAEKLKNKLLLSGKEAWLGSVPEGYDPGSLPANKAKELVQQILQKSLER